MSPRYRHSRRHSHPQTGWDDEWPWRGGVRIEAAPVVHPPAQTVAIFYRFSCLPAINGLSEQGKELWRRCGSFVLGSDMMEIDSGMDRINGAPRLDLAFAPWCPIAGRLGEKA